MCEALTQNCLCGTACWVKKQVISICDQAGSIVCTNQRGQNLTRNFECIRVSFKMADEKDRVWDTVEHKQKVRKYTE